MDRSLVVAAALLIGVQVAYFAYWAAGLTAVLWDQGQGFYFSENDVLHIGMMLWLLRGRGGALPARCLHRGHGG